MEARIAELLKEFQTLQSELDTVKGTAQTSTASSVATHPFTTKNRSVVHPFETFLHKESEGPEVTKLQRFLAQYPDIYPAATITGYFGSYDRSRRQALSAPDGIVSTGAPTVTGYGLTRHSYEKKIKRIDHTKTRRKAKAVVAPLPCHCAAKRMDGIVLAPPVQRF